MISELRVIDLCSGAGGWACAARGLPLSIVAAVDCWDLALRTYRHNFPGTETIEGDLRQAALVQQLAESWRGRVDVVLGGIPCEWLSVYRNLNGVAEAERESHRRLLDNVLWLVRELSPRWWCLEDVIQLRRELPPLTPYHLLDARWWSPQRRKRLFVGEFPVPKRPAKLVSEQLTLGQCLRPGPYRMGVRAMQREPRRSFAFTRSAALAVEPGRKGPTVVCLSSRRDGEVLVRDERVPGGWRQPEWQEWARLQGFPEDYVFVGSPEAVWKMVGQAVQIDLGSAILRAMVQHAAS